MTDTTKIIPTMKKEDHFYSSEDKLKWWGCGEWAEEPDYIEFSYKEYNCKIVRIIEREPYTKKFHMYGGHLCAYVCIPPDHPYYNKEYDDINIDCHCGLTFGKLDFNKRFWIGFDCAHSGDYIPSMEYLKKTMPSLIEIQKLFPIPEEFKNFSIFNPVYRNVKFCIDECISMVDQLTELKND